MISTLVNPRQDITGSHRELVMEEKERNNIPNTKERSKLLIF